MSIDVDHLCEMICMGMGAEGADTMLSMCGNDGQVSIIESALDDYMNCAEQCSEGDAPGFSTDYDDAVGEIVEAGQAFLDEAADVCRAIRDAASVGDIDGASNYGEEDVGS